MAKRKAARKASRKTKTTTKKRTTKKATKKASPQRKVAAKKTAPKSKSKVTLELVYREIISIQTGLTNVTDFLLGRGSATKLANTETKSNDADQMGLFDGPTPANGEVGFTKEDVTQKLQEIGTAHGNSRVKELLDNFQAARISDLDPNKYTNFMTACEETLGNNTGA